MVVLSTFTSSTFRTYVYEINKLFILSSQSWRLRLFQTSSVCVCVCLSVCPAFTAYVSVTIGLILMKLVGSVGTKVRLIVSKFHLSYHNVLQKLSLLSKTVTPAYRSCRHMQFSVTSFALNSYRQALQTQRISNDSIYMCVTI